MVMQTAGKEAPGGFVADEYQEWLRLRALPKIREAAKQHFRKGKNHWFNQKAYDRLCADLQFCATGENPMFLLSMDSDSRHSCTDYHNLGGRGRHMDRRLLPAGTPGYIPMDPIRNKVPSAPKVPDSLQVLFESFFGPVKRHFRRLLKDKEDPSPGEMAAAMRAAFQLCAGNGHIHHCFEHGRVCMQVFSGLENEVVEYKSTKYHCTHGKWLPRDLAA